MELRRRKNVERAYKLDGPGTCEDTEKQAAVLNLRVSRHAQIEMDAENITLDDVLEAIARGSILEDYSEHLRKP